MTIGRPNGNAWIGKPLDLVIPLTLDSSESGDSLCLEADVLQGDVRIDDKRVTLSLDPGPSPDTPRVRLRTTRAIEEPVVTVRLSAGCAMKSTRQYVLLADLPEAPPVVAAAPAPARSTSQSDAQSADIASVPQIAPVPQPPPRTARAARGDAGRAAPSSGSAAGSEAPPPRRRVAPVPVQRPQRSAAAEATQKPRPQAPRSEAAPTPPAESKEGKPRLKVEPLAPEPVREPPAKPAPALASPETDDAAKRAQASAAGAQVQAQAPSPVQPQAQPQAPAQPPSGPPSEQSQRDAERLKELENALASLREQSAQTQRLLLEMRGEIAQAQASRYRNPLVYGLLALLALALIALAMLWRAARRARVPLWWSSSEEEGASHAPKTALPRRGELVDDEDEDDDEVSARADLTGLRSAHGLRVTALPAGVGASAFERAQVRSVNTEELYDVQQQAEFYLSLGQHEQAIGVLREHIAVRPATSALAYLDLLAIFHSLGRREDYATLAREFQHKFNAEAPAFDTFSGEGRGLEHYQGVLARIVSTWPSRGTLDLIEELVFRKPGSREELFDLAAYEELLLLHAVAHDVSEHEGPWATPVPAPPLVPSQPRAGADEDLQPETAPMPYLPAAATESARPREEMPPLELDLADLDRTAFETLRAPVEPPAAKPAPAPSSDPHVIDFDPFDPGSEADLRPRHLGVKR
ncbi:MAG TPA: hypothetical protein VLJ19_04050 [Variovorax sp.]|nr:hypothetical protein [Variovorax sp.]